MIHFFYKSWLLTVAHSFWYPRNWKWTGPTSKLDKSIKHIQNGKAYLANTLKCTWHSVSMSLNSLNNSILVIYCHLLITSYHIFKQTRKIYRLAGHSWLPETIIWNSPTPLNVQVFQVGTVFAQWYHWSVCKSIDFR